MDCLYNKYKVLESSSFNPTPYLYSDISFLFVKYYPKFKNLFRYLFGYPESFSELLNSVEKYANEHNPKNILSFFDHENTDDLEYYDYVLENYSYRRIRCYLNGVMEEKMSSSYFFMVLSFILCPKRIIENLIKYIKSEFAELKSIGL